VVRVHAQVRLAEQAVHRAGPRRRDTALPLLAHALAQDLQVAAAAPRRQGQALPDALRRHPAQDGQGLRRRLSELERAVQGAEGHGVLLQVPEEHGGQWQEPGQRERSVQAARAVLRDHRAQAGEEQQRGDPGQPRQPGRSGQAHY